MQGKKPERLLDKGEVAFLDFSPGSRAITPAAQDSTPDWSAGSTLVSSHMLREKAHSPWVDMYYRRPKQELRPMVEKFLAKCDDANGWISKLHEGRHDAGVIETVFSNLEQADKHLNQKNSRVRDWLLTAVAPCMDTGEKLDDLQEVVWASADVSKVPLASIFSCVMCEWETNDGIYTQI